MRLDYSDKMGAVRESAERKPVPKNRPRKAPIGMFAVLSVLLLLGVTFGAGVMTGWFLFKGDASPAATPASAAPQVKQQEPVPAALPPTAAAPQDAPLTFYKTLPSGGHGAMGSGVNLKLSDPPPQPKTAPVAAPVAKPAEEKPAGEKQAGEKQAGEKQAGEKTGAQPRFLVQIASYRDKQEAEAVLAKLSAKGVAAYLVESKVKEKGVWYRLRVGRHLSRHEAEQLAGKVGSGATVLTE